MNYVLYDGQWREHLLPFSYTRPVGMIRVGITTIKEKWEYLLGGSTSFLTKPYLQEKYPLKTDDDNIFIHSSIIPTKELADHLSGLRPGEGLKNNGELIAVRRNSDGGDGNPFDETEKIIETNYELMMIRHPWDIFKLNPVVINEDFARITLGRKSQPVPPGTIVTGSAERLFIEEGAEIRYANLNTENGPVYIGKDAKVMEGSLIRGPFALCEKATIKMGARIYEGTTIGPWSKVGGEVQNSVIFGYSSKAHEGYLGNSVIGEWCNLGADTNTSNLKNTYENIKVWSFAEETFIQTGEQFCGLLMGDHSKSGINTMFNTGTVVGVFCNIFGSGYQRNLIPSFSWGGTHGFKLYNLKRAFEVAEAVMRRRNLHFSETDKKILSHLYQQADIRP